MSAIATNPHTSAPRSFREVWLITIGHSLTHWYPATFYLLLPLIGKELGLSYSQIGLVMTCQYLAGAISNVPGGMLVDTVGRKGPLLAVSLFWVGFPYALMGFSHSYALLLLCVSLVGIGNNLWHPTAIPGMSYAAHGDRHCLSRAHISPVAVAVVDGDGATTEVMRKVIGGCREFSITGFFRTAAEAIEGLRTSHCDVVLIDLALPDLCGIRCARELRGSRPHVSTILVTALTVQWLIERAIASGMDHCLKKPLERAQALITLRCAAARLHPHLWPSATVSNANRPPLNHRLEQVMACLDEGLFYKEIAERLQMSLPTARKLVHNALAKLNAANKVEALNRWRELKLASETNEPR